MSLSDKPARRTAAPAKPEEVPEGRIRLMNGLKWAAIVGGSVFAVLTVGAIAMGASHPLMAAAAYYGGTTFAPQATGMAMGALFGVVPAVAAGVGFLIGATDEKPIVMAKAEKRRDWMQAQREAAEASEMGLAREAELVSAENQMHREAHGAGGLSAPVFGGAAGAARGAGQRGGGGLFT